MWGSLRAERRRREARREIFTIPELVTARQSILGPPAEGRPGPSNYKKIKNMADLESSAKDNYFFKAALVSMLRVLSTHLTQKI